MHKLEIINFFVIEKWSYAKFDTFYQLGLLKFKIDFLLQHEYNECVLYIYSLHVRSFFCVCVFYSFVFILFIYVCVSVCVCMRVLMYVCLWVFCVGMHMYVYDCVCCIKCECLWVWVDIFSWFNHKDELWGFWVTL